jgi:hypothetical protein
MIWTGVLLLCLIFTPETHEPTLLHQKALATRRITGIEAYKSNSEIIRASKSLSNALIHSMYRPFQLLALEPMCLLLCIYSAVLLGVLYLFFGAFVLIFRTNHDFNLWQTGLSFVGIGLGTVLATFTNPIWHKNYDRLVRNLEADAKRNGEEKVPKPEPEFRLPPAIFGAVAVTVSMFWFGWTTYRSIHWIVPMIATVVFGGGYVHSFRHLFKRANVCSIFLVFSSIWTFLVAAYPAYAASALAANTFARCMFAAAFPLFGEQSMYCYPARKSLSVTQSVYEKLNDQWATSLLAFITLAMMPLP